MLPTDNVITIWVSVVYYIHTLIVVLSNSFLSRFLNDFWVSKEYDELKLKKSNIISRIFWFSFNKLSFGTCPKVGQNSILVHELYMSFQFCPWTIRLFQNFVLGVLKSLKNTSMLPLPCLGVSIRMAIAEMGKSGCSFFFLPLNAIFCWLSIHTISRSWIHSFTLYMQFYKQDMTNCPQNWSKSNSKSP